MIQGHWHTTSASNLAWSLSNQGKYAEAERTKREVPGVQGCIPSSHNLSSARGASVTPGPARCSPPKAREPAGAMGPF